MANNEINRLRQAVQLAIDFHSADTETFVKNYGTGMTTRGLCDRLRASLQPQESQQPARPTIGDMRVECPACWIGRFGPHPHKGLLRAR